MHGPIYTASKNLVKNKLQESGGLSLGDWEGEVEVSGDQLESQLRNSGQITERRARDA